jgi:hypothetical protein
LVAAPGHRVGANGLQVGDARVAATAIEHQLPVLTASVKHFGAVQGPAHEPFMR